METYTLTPDDLSMIRNSLLFRAQAAEREEYPALSKELRDLRERLFGVASVVITYHADRKEG